jgi:hypothetical protein
LIGRRGGLARFGNREESGCQSDSRIQQRQERSEDVKVRSEKVRNGRAEKVEQERKRRRGELEEQSNGRKEKRGSFESRLGRGRLG